MPLTPAQFEEAVRVHGPQLRRCLHYLTRGHAQDTDDLLQRTFECAWFRRDQYEGGAVDAWLRAIARFVHLTYTRGEARNYQLRTALFHWLSTLHEPAPPPIDQHALARCIEQLSFAQSSLARGLNPEES